ncbi:MAG: hypothetical protein ABIR67_03520 [Gaiellaceae bacterium]
MGCCRRGQATSTAQRGASQFHGTALLDLAQVLALLGDGSPPPDVVAEALSLFERKQDAASLRRAATVFAGVPLAS